MIQLVAKIREYLMTTRRKLTPVTIPSDLLPITPSLPPTTLTIQSYETRSKRSNSKFVSPPTPASASIGSQSLKIRNQLKQNLTAINEQLEVLSVSTEGAASKHNTSSSGSNKDTVSTISIESTGKSTAIALADSENRTRSRSFSMSVDDPFTSDVLLDTAGLGISGDHAMLGMTSDSLLSTSELMHTGFEL